MANLEKKENQLVRKIFIYPLILIVLSIVLTAGLIYLKLKIHEKEDISNGVKAIINTKKIFLKNKVLDISNNIDLVLKFAKKKSKKDIKSKVDDVYFQLLSLYNLPIKNKKEMAIDYLNNLNKFRKNNYIFAYDAKSGVVYVHKIKKLIGKNTKNIFVNNISVYERNKKVLKNGGFYETYFYKPNNLDKKILKINYIKYVPQFNLVIGSGEYIDDIKKRIINNILQRLMLKRYENNKYFFILKPNGILLVNPFFKNLIGKNILNLKDTKGKEFIKEMIKKAMKNKGGAFITYYWINPLTKKEEKKISFVIYNKNLDAIIGSGLYYKHDVENYIHKKQIQLKKKFLSFNISIFLIVIIMLFVSLIISFYLYKRIKNIFKVYSKTTRELLEKVDFEAKHDHLTKVPNRRYFNEKLEEEFYRAKRYNEPLSLAILDIDFFKKINDTYGHDAGDKVLKKLAEFCSTHIRKSDFFARWGGEEFVFIFPHTDIQKAKKICEKIKNELQNDKKIQTPIKFTISCGITQLRDEDSMDTFLKRADKALYEAKEGGRDKIVIL